MPIDSIALSATPPIKVGFKFMSLSFVEPASGERLVNGRLVGTRDSHVKVTLVMKRVDLAPGSTVFRAIRYA
jgi:hypothetical protein